MPPVMDTVVRALAGVFGFTLILAALLSAIRNFVLPRAAPDPITRAMFRLMRKLFDAVAPASTSYAWRDRVMALYGPVCLLLLPLLWNFLAWLGYGLIYWAMGVAGLWESLRLSGSSLLTLGFATPPANVLPTLIVFTDAIIGPLLISLLISYLPTIYGAFSRRELLVTQMSVRAGTPASPITMIELYHGVNGLDRMKELWPQWENWFHDLSESHTSLPVLSFFRSPKPDVSWITAAGAVLDAAALLHSTVPGHKVADAGMCMRSGWLALRAICDFFGITYPPDPKFPDPISISRQEYDEAYDRLKTAGIDVYPDREQCWKDFAGWRVNYDLPLVSLAGMLVAPPALWSSDRSFRPRLARVRPALFQRS